MSFVALRVSRLGARACRPLLVTLLATGLSTPADATSEVVISFSGLHYEVAENGGADPTPAEALAIGDSYAFVGHITGFADAMLPHVDTEANEYTVVISGGTVASRQSYAAFHLASLSGTLRLEVYEDAIATGTGAVLAANPPNADVPSKFADGTRVLGAALPDFSIVWNETTRAGNWSASITFDTGPLLPFIPVERGDKGLLVGGQVTPEPVPPGYHLKSLGETRTAWIDPVELKTWGALKQLYR